MQIDWTHFTPWTALAGGVLIGLSTAWLWLLDGRILGASGVLGGLAQPRPGHWQWRLALLAGLVASATAASALFGTEASSTDASWPILILSGLLVGVGTRLADGCTSGHGVCGLARLSPRSAAATLAFMASGFATVFLVRHVLG